MDTTQQQGEPPEPMRAVSNPADEQSQASPEDFENDPSRNPHDEKLRNVKGVERRCRGEAAR
jgi:hypothetical protein